MLYSKLGSIPKTDTDGTEGWVEVDDLPSSIPEGYEVVWWSPPGWVIRPIKPEATETKDFSWDQPSNSWVEYSTAEITVIT